MANNSDFFHKRKIATFLKKSRFTNFKLILDVGAHKGESIDFFLTHLVKVNKSHNQL